jgi:hypothetical protein
MAEGQYLRESAPVRRWMVLLFTAAILFFAIESLYLGILSTLLGARPEFSFVSALILYTFDPLKEPMLLLFQLSYPVTAIGSFYLAKSLLTRRSLERIIEGFYSPRPTSDQQFSGIESLILDIEGRISRLQRRSNLILSIIIITLLVGVVLIIFAGRLTSIDAESASNMSILRDEIASIDRSITDINSKISRLIHPPKIANEPAISVPPDDIDIKNLLEEKQALAERRNNAIHILKSIWETETTVSNRDKLKDSNYVMATFLTRIGILAILIFLVQLLVSLYKYNTRIAAFYASRLDCLRIGSGDVDKLRSLIELMTPINVDFGRDPRHPVETLMEAWRNRSGRQSSGETSTPTSAKPSSGQRQAGRRTPPRQGSGTAPTTPAPVTG